MPGSPSAIAKRTCVSSMPAEVVEVVAPASRAGVGERVAAGAHFVEARAGVRPAVLLDRWTFTTLLALATVLVERSRRRRCRRSRPRARAPPAAGTRAAAAPAPQPRRQSPSPSRPPRFRSIPRRRARPCRAHAHPSGQDLRFSGHCRINRQSHACLSRNLSLTIPARSVSSFSVSSARPAIARGPPRDWSPPVPVAQLVAGDCDDVGDEFFVFARGQHVSEGRHAGFAFGDRGADVRLVPRAPSCDRGCSASRVAPASASCDSPRRLR